MARSAALDLAGQAREEAPPGEGLNRWFDRCYSTWKRQQRMLLFAVLAITWLPFLLFVWFSVPAIRTHLHLPRLFIQLTIAVQSNFFVATMGLALWIGVLACSSYRVTPEIQLTGPKRSTYKFLRSRVRRTAYRWMLGLVLIPNSLAFALMLVLRFTHHTLLAHAPPWWSYIYYRQLAVFALAFWCGAELVQFIVLKSPQWRASTKVLAVLAVMLAYVSLRINTWSASKYLREAAPWLPIALGYLLYPLIPLALATYMLLATRRPTPAMLERL